MRTLQRHVVMVVLACFGSAFAARAQENAGDLGAVRRAAVAESVTVAWDRKIRVSRSTPTLQVVVMPPLRRGSPIHARAWAALRELKASHVRYVPWVPYPRLSVAALEAPGAKGTSWDFSLIDPMTADFMAAMEGRPAMVDFSTTPAWMWQTDKPVPYEADPNKLVRGYGTQGTELRDTTGTQLGAYYARLLGWYTQGGFTDELGKRHDSGHRYRWSSWEVFNEPDIEHRMTPEQYTRRYDAIVLAMKRVAPDMKFVGMSLAYPGKAADFFEYFLDPRNHRPGAPVDMISYHFYAKSTPDMPPSAYAFSFFEQADRFVDVARYIDAIRRRLAPGTGTAVNEVGTILPGTPHDSIPASYWNISGAVFAYTFAEVAKLGIEIVAQSQLLGFPGQFPSVSMLDWSTGEPNARYRALELMIRSFAPGDTLVETPLGRYPAVHAQGFAGAGGRRILLVNRRDAPVTVAITGGTGATVTVVDQASAGAAPKPFVLPSNVVRLGGYAVAVVTLPQ